MAEGVCMNFAKLDEKKYERLRELERELGTGIIAVEQKCHWTNLDQEKLQKLQEAEKEFGGAVLLAYEAEMEE